MFYIFFIIIVNQICQTYHLIKLNAICKNGIIMEQLISVVTGGNGFVGSHLVDYLIKKGHEVRCIVRKSSDLKWLQNKNVKIFTCGLADREELGKIIKDADYIYHVAGVVKSKKKEGYFKGNVEPTRNILDVCLKVNPKIRRILIVSSLTACGPSKIGHPCNESTKENPITTYGKSKFMQEQLSKSYFEKLPITIVRPPAVYGPRDTEIYLVFKTFQKGLMTLVGFNKKELSLVHVSDLVHGIYLASISESSVGKTYFIGSDETTNWNSVSDILEKVFNKKALKLRIPHIIVYAIAAVAQFLSVFSNKPATFNLEKAKDFVQEAWTCDISKAKNELGFQPSINIETGLRQTIEWYRAEKWL